MIHCITNPLFGNVVSVVIHFVSLQVFDVKELDAQLNAAAMAYLNPHVTINVGVGKVTQRGRFHMTVSSS